MGKNRYMASNHQQGTCDKENRLPSALANLLSRQTPQASRSQLGDRGTCSCEASNEVQGNVGDLRGGRQKKKEKRRRGGVLEFQSSEDIAGVKSGTEKECGVVVLFPFPSLFNIRARVCVGGVWVVEMWHRFLLAHNNTFKSRDHILLRLNEFHST